MFKALRSKLHSICEWWMEKNPAEKWIAISDFGRIMCESIGIHVFSDMKNNWYSASCGICAAIYFALNFYTIQFYLRRNEIVKIIECTYFIGIVIGVGVAVIFFIFIYAVLLV